MSITSEAYEIACRLSEFGSEYYFAFRPVKKIQFFRVWICGTYTYFRQYEVIDESIFRGWFNLKGVRLPACVVFSPDADPHAGITHEDRRVFGKRVLRCKNSNPGRLNNYAYFEDAFKRAYRHKIIVIH